MTRVVILKAPRVRVEVTPIRAVPITYTPNGGAPVVVGFEAEVGDG